MTDSLLNLVSVYGVWFLGISTFLSCIAIPIPTSLMLLVTGGFVAGGDIILTNAILMALFGAVGGDQAGYFIGRYGGTPLLARFGHAPKRKKLVEKATSLLQRRGFWAVFLSRWLVAPLGPYVNLAGGASGLNHRQFSIGSISGEVIWVCGYIALGYAFSNSITLIADLASNATGFLAAVSVVIGLILWLRAAAKQRHIHKS